MASELAEKIDNGEKPKPAEVLRDTVYGYQEHFALALKGNDGSALIDPAKFCRVAYTAIRKSERLQQASLPSLMGALMACAQLGLEPSGPLGQAYLVPFFDSKTKQYEVQLIIGYQGLVELAYRSGRLMSIKADLVYTNDTFDWELGTNAHIVHRPKLSADRGEVLGVYAIANMVGGGQVFDVMSKEQIDRIRAISKSGENGPWKDHYEAMARKTAIRQLFKWLPASVEDHPALGADGGVFRQIPERAEDAGDPDFVDVEEIT